MNTHTLIGIVHKGQLVILDPDEVTGVATRLTSIAMQEARPPESGAIDLSDYEDKAIMVTGYGSGPWIYSAEIMETAGPMLTAVVGKLFTYKKEV